MTKIQVQKILKMGEGQHIEFKESLSTLKKAIKTLASFGGQARGGWLFFGVYDDGTIKGIDVGKNTIEKLANDIKENTLSMIWAEPLLPEIYEFPDLSILAVRVTQKNVDKGPYLAYGHRYNRTGKSTHEVKVNYKLFAQYYNKHLHPENSNEPYEANFSFCPECGSKKLKKIGASSEDGDCMFRIICEECGWEESGIF